MAKTTIELPELLHRKLRVMAALDGCSMNEIVIEAISRYLRDFRLEPGMLELETVPTRAPKEG